MRRRHVEITFDFLEPLKRVAGGGLETEDLDAALGPKVGGAQPGDDDR